MKKLKSIIAATVAGLVALVACACESAAPTLSLDTPAPWVYSGEAKDAYEKCVYSVEKRDVTTDTVIAAGTMTCVIEPAENDKNRLTTSMTITYNDAAPETERGLTDTVDSHVTFSPVSLAPESSYKKIVLASRENETTNFSYELNTDYTTGISTLNYFNRENATSEVKVGDSTLMNVFDNEMLYYVARAASGIKTEGSGSFANACFFDMHGTGKFAYRTINFSCGKETESVVLDELFARGHGYTADASVAAIKTSLTQSGEDSGPAIELWLSSTDFKVGSADTDKTRKVMVKMATTEYNVSAAAKQYVTTYTLTDYSVVKP